MIEVRFGIDSSLKLSDEQAERVVCPGEGGLPESLDDVADAVACGLADPVDYPPLAAIITPSDRVAVTVTGDVPRAETITAAAIRAIIEAGVAPERITILYQADGPLDPRAWLPASWADEIHLVAVDPADPDAFARLGVDDQGEPVVVHRALYEADFVLPIVSVRRASAGDYFGPLTEVYPRLSDEPTRQRFRSLDAMRPGRARDQRIEEVAHAGQLLGADLTIQVIPASCDQVHGLVVGATSSITPHVRAADNARWRRELAAPVELVVAAIEGGPRAQTWTNVGRALQASLPLLPHEGGAIAICCDLDAPPDAGVRFLSSQLPRDQVVGHILAASPPDTYTAVYLAAALERASVYLLSRLDEEVVEGLGMVPVGSADELSRLIGRFESVAILPNAPLADVSTTDNQPPDIIPADWTEASPAEIDDQPEDMFYDPETLFDSPEELQDMMHQSEEKDQEKDR